MNRSTRSSLVDFLLLLQIPSLMPCASVMCSLLSQFCFVLTPFFPKGIFGGQSQSLSVKSCFPILHEYELQYGSVGLGMIRQALTRQEQEKGDIQKASPTVREMQMMKVYSFKEGIETLTRALEEKLRKDPNMEIRLGTGVEKIQQVCFLSLYSAAHPFFVTE